MDLDVALGKLKQLKFQLDLQPRNWKKLKMLCKKLEEITFNNNLIIPQLSSKIMHI